MHMFFQLFDYMQVYTPLKLGYAVLFGIIRQKLPTILLSYCNSSVHLLLAPLLSFGKSDQKLQIRDVKSRYF